MSVHLGRLGRDPGDTAMRLGRRALGVAMDFGYGVRALPALERLRMVVLPCGQRSVLRAMRHRSLE